MCGLVGIAGDVDIREKNNFRSFLDVCQTRGRDSTGVIKVDRDLDYTWVKRIGPPAFLYDSKEYEETIVAGGVCAALIGHCRHKTSGDISNKTAHPFDFPDAGICGVHNGTLRDYRHLDTYDYKKVDSEVLYGHLAENGPEDTFPEITGAWACVWWDNKAETLNFIRNAERPLWFAWSKDQRKLYWASERWMFGAIERPGETQGTELLKDEDGNTKFFELPVDQLWSFEILYGNVNKRDQPMFKLKPIKNIKGKEVRSYSGNYPPFTPNTPNTSNTATKPWLNPNFRRNERTGAYERVPHRAPGSGGEVTNPFPGGQVLATVVESENGVSVRITPRGPAQLVDINGTPLSSKDAETSTTGLKRLLARSTGSTNTPPSSKPSTSPRPILSAVSPRTSKNESSENSEELRGQFGVSHRVVAGIAYITNNRDSSEFSEEEFDRNTGGVCCHCNTPIGDLHEVDEIFDRHTFICKSCVTPRPLRAVA